MRVLTCTRFAGSGGPTGLHAPGGPDRARLVPPGLDPDPLATVERLVAAQKAEQETTGTGQGEE
jgi:hypothetical protein